MMKKVFVSAVIVAAGNSTRMGTGAPKIFENVLGVPSLSYTLNAFNNADLVNEIIIVCKPEHREKISKIIKDNNILKFKCFADGGASRQASVFSGVKKINTATTHIAVHDAARILVTENIINDVIIDSIKSGASSVGVPMKDTIKVVDGDCFIENTLDRSFLWNVQTPQVFFKNLYIDAMKQAINLNKDYTDDCQLIENYGGKVHMIMGSYSNLKLTTIDDIPIFEAILKRRKDIWE